MEMLPLLLSALLLSTSVDLWMMMPQALSDAVFDMDGQMLQTGTQYNVLPGVHVEGGGGLTLGFRNGNCPMNVAQHESNTSSGLPLTISPVNASLTAIPVSTGVKVVFAAATICVQSTAWRLGQVDRATGRRYVTTGRGVSTVSDWFKIEKYEDYYKLVSCQSVCIGCNVVCGDVGVVREGGKRWLVLSDEPFPVVFKKV
ncbi:hypothetical protein AAC387_Pa10g1978 [Persea americana]